MKHSFLYKLLFLNTLSVSSGIFETFETHFFDFFDFVCFYKDLSRFLCFIMFHLCFICVSFCFNVFHFSY